MELNSEKLLLLWQEELQCFGDHGYHSPWLRRPRPHWISFSR
ncbi:hypothetical protein QTI45_35020 [Variovorax sp. J22R187]|nr:hypothetical protein [Variovorax sp. J22R187]